MRLVRQRARGLPAQLRPGMRVCRPGFSCSDVQPGKSGSGSEKAALLSDENSGQTVSASLRPVFSAAAEPLYNPGGGTVAVRNHSRFRRCRQGDGTACHSLSACRSRNRQRRGNQPGSDCGAGILRYPGNCGCVFRLTFPGKHYKMKLDYAGSVFYQKQTAAEKSAAGRRPGSTERGIS